MPEHNTQKERHYFGTDGIRGVVGEHPITPEFMLKLGWAIGQVLGSGPKDKVFIGKDTRISGYIFESALEAGLTSAGLDTYLLGPIPTPAIAYLTRKYKAQAGIVISASHNAYTDNGIKLFCQNGFKLPDSVEEKIEATLNEPFIMASPASLGKAFRLDDAVDQYVEHCSDILSPEFQLNGLRIVLDCANGATYRVAPNVLSKLGASLVNLAVNPNGLNINLNCGSTKPNTLQETVKAIGADLGIAFDGDGDRVILVDSHGEILDGDEILFIIACHQKKSLPGVVGTQMSNMGLELAFQDRSIPFERTQVGDRYVLERLREKQWTLGGEASGHIVDLSVSTTGDGLLSALQVLRAMQVSGKTLVELKQGMQKFPQLVKNIQIPRRASSIINQQGIQSAIRSAETALGIHGRILIRESGTEPLIRVMAEGRDLMHVEAVLADLVLKVEQSLAN